MRITNSLTLGSHAHTVETHTLPLVRSRWRLALALVYRQVVACRTHSEAVRKILLNAF
jgi:hypothetical protein